MKKRMKKRLICGAIVAAATLSTSALALDRSNTGQKGSLLVFPKIDVSAGRDTLVRIENTYPRAVDLTCYWQNGEKLHIDQHFELTKRQPIALIASEGFPTGFGPLPGFGPVDRGELKCWAVSEDGTTEISHNHLSGTATIIDFEAGTAHQYTAWAFRCVVEGGNQGAPCVVDDSIGSLDLDGTEYEACPRVLNIGFSPTGAFGGLFGPSTLHVSTCNQDFRQDKDFHFTKLQFKTWREDETAYTGSYSCIDSWHETTLDGVQHLPQNFSLTTLGNVARMEVRAVPSIRCPFPTHGSGLVGVLATEIGDDVIGTNLVGFGHRRGYVVYDTDEIVEEGIGEGAAQ